MRSIITIPIRAIIASAALAACHSSPPPPPPDAPIEAACEPRMCPGVDYGTQDTAVIQNDMTSPGTGALSAYAQVWYAYHAYSGEFSTIDPNVSLTSDGPLVVCQYMSCPISGCPANTRPATATGGQNGCCADSPGGTTSFELDGCASNDVTVWVSVVSAVPQACPCTTFSIDYGW